MKQLPYYTFVPGEVALQQTEATMCMYITIVPIYAL